MIDEEEIITLKTPSEVPPNPPPPSNEFMITKWIDLIACMFQCREFSKITCNKLCGGCPCKDMGPDEGNRMQIRIARLLNNLLNLSLFIATPIVILNQNSSDNVCAVSFKYWLAIYMSLMIAAGSLRMRFELTPKKSPMYREYFMRAFMCHVLLWVLYVYGFVIMASIESIGCNEMLSILVVSLEVDVIFWIVTMCCMCEQLRST